MKHRVYLATAAEHQHVIIEETTKKDGTQIFARSGDGRTLISFDTGYTGRFARRLFMANALHAKTPLTFPGEDIRPVRR